MQELISPRLAKTTDARSPCMPAPTMTGFLQILPGRCHVHHHAAAVCPGRRLAFRDGSLQRYRLCVADFGEARSGQLLARFRRMTGHARLECRCTSRGVAIDLAVARFAGARSRNDRGNRAVCLLPHSASRRSDPMRTLIRRARWIAGFALACLAGSLPSCASMGGGGMKYFVSPPFMESAST